MTPSPKPTPAASRGSDDDRATRPPATAAMGLSAGVGPSPQQTQQGQDGQFRAGFAAGLERAAQYHDREAADCEAIAKVNADNDLGPDAIGHAADHKVAADDLRKLARAHPQKVEGKRWRHIKRGSTYTEIGRAELQANKDVIEGMTFVVYRSEKDGKLWVRQEDEFEDGRFEPLPLQEEGKTE